MTSSEPESVRRFKFLPLSMRLETQGGIATPLVLRGTPLPARRSEIFTTAVDNQTSVEVHVLIGESALAKRCASLGKVKLLGIPSALRGTPQIRVDFEVDQRCAIHVTASVDGTPLNASADLSPDAHYLTDEAINALRTDAEAHAEEDQRQISVTEAVQSAERAVQLAEQRLASEGDQATRAIDRNMVTQQIAAVGQALETEDVDRIRECTRALETSLMRGEGLGSLFDGFFTAPPARAPRQPSRPARRATPPPTSRERESAGTVAPTQLSHLPLGKIFGGGQFTLDSNLCFVLMPFAETFRPIYEDHIRPTIHAEGLTCLRADEIRGTSLITRDIWEKINRARLLIADLTGQNANVFYEVGLAHALGKDVLLLTQTMTDVPFDLKAMRCIVYNYTPRGMKEMETALRATVAALTRSG